jgi:hypothetical protein
LWLLLHWLQPFQPRTEPCPNYRCQLPNAKLWIRSWLRHQHWTVRFRLEIGPQQNVRSGWQYARPYSLPYGWLKHQSHRLAPIGVPSQVCYVDYCYVGHVDRLGHIGRPDEMLLIQHCQSLPHGSFDPELYSLNASIYAGIVQGCPSVAICCLNVGAHLEQHLSLPKIIDIETVGCLNVGLAGQVLINLIGRSAQWQVTCRSVRPSLPGPLTLAPAVPTKKRAISRSLLPVIFLTDKASMRHSIARKVFNSEDAFVQCCPSMLV